MRRQIRAAASGQPEKTKSPSEAFLNAPEAWRLRYLLNDDFAGFHGHFEGHPILPALAQVFIAQDLVQALLGRPAILAGITQAKFLSPVTPGSLLSAYAAVVEKTGEWRVHLTSTAGDSTMEIDAAFLRLKFKEDDNGL